MLCSCSVSKQTAPIEFHHKSAGLQASNSNIVVKNNLVPNQEVILPKTLYDEDNVIFPESAENNNKFIYHEVKIGEFIEDIARHYDQTIKEIAMLNGLTYPYIVEEYQILKIPNNDKQKLVKDEKKSEKDKKNIFILPLKGKIISQFGSNTALGPNKGINIEAESGTEIIASISGRVVYSSYDATYGNLVIIKSNKYDIFTSYAHMKSTEIAPGDHVHQGEVIGYVGSSGKVKTPQLHFGIREGKTPKNPLNFIN